MKNSTFLLLLGTIIALCVAIFSGCSSPIDPPSPGRQRVVSTNHLPDLVKAVEDPDTTSVSGVAVYRSQYAERRIYRWTVYFSKAGGWIFHSRTRPDGFTEATVIDALDRSITPQETRP